MSEQVCKQWNDHPTRQGRGMMAHFTPAPVSAEWLSSMYQLISELEESLRAYDPNNELLDVCSTMWANAKLNDGADELRQLIHGGKHVNGWGFIAHQPQDTK